MRILQLIDSLDAGGAERVAVNLANALVPKVEKSFLCTTRREGLLKESILSDVKYLFLKKKKTIDFSATQKLHRFIKKHRIQIIHAHSTSFFLATIVKFLNPKIVVVWHDHYGNSEFLQNREDKVLKWCSKYFAHTFSVNRPLENWAKQKLKLKNVTNLPNFAVADTKLKLTQLKGEDGKRIICLANLRPQKDHFTLIEAFDEVLKENPEWTLHCIGKDFKDDYSKSIQQKMKAYGVENSVFFYGSKPDVSHILSQCEIGVLSSKSEGLPIALLEYGLSSLAVVATKVGECGNVVLHEANGLLVTSSNSKELANAIRSCIQNQELRTIFASEFNKHVEGHYSEKVQIQTILKVYKQSLTNS
ncbi:glycosyltransferase [Tamlana crocina]